MSKIHLYFIRVFLYSKKTNIIFPNFAKRIKISEAHKINAKFLRSSPYPTSLYSPQFRYSIKKLFFE